MDQKSRPPMTPLDSLIVTEELQMMKLLIPYTPPANQQFLAVFVKFQELQNTMRYFRGFRKRHSETGFHASASPVEILDEMRPFMSGKDSETIDSIVSAMQMMETFSAMEGSGMFNGTSEGASSGFGQMNPMDMMKGMLTPEQQEMFDTYNTMFAQSMDSEERTNQEQNGGDDNGELDESSGDEKHGSTETGVD